MPKYRQERQEQGVRYTIHEVVAYNKEEAQEKIWNGEAMLISEHFKQHDADVLSFKKIAD